jgi:hypothetical protein
VLALYDLMLSRARQAIQCWSMAGRRLAVAKDIQVLIAKMMWEEAWRWGEWGADAECENAMDD